MDSLSKSKLIAIVDDEDDIVKLFRDALGTINGITVFTFTDPVMALEHFKLNKDNYVLVITDLRMPGLAGTELIKELKKLNRFIRTILMTAFAINDNLFQEFAKKELINGFLQKPIHLDGLRAEVNNQLHTYELQKQESFIKVT
ncbi:MAG: response regulator [Nitrososphaerota archaeon]